MKLLCKLGIHKYKTTEKWEPNFDAPIVIAVTWTTRCINCFKLKEIESLEFDPKTGEFLE